MITSVSSIASSVFVSSLDQRKPDTGNPLAKEEEKKGIGFSNEDKKPVSKPSKEDPNKLTDEEREQVEELKKRDQEVRTHEAAHMAAAGALAKGGPNYTYQRGPDGRNYAVGGNVQIDTSKGRTAKETIAKAQQIRAAALAPADPSPQDMKVAAQASRMEAEAIQELQKEQAEAASENNSEDSSNVSREKYEQTDSASTFAPFGTGSHSAKRSDETQEDFADRVNETYTGNESSPGTSLTVFA